MYKVTTLEKWRGYITMSTYDFNNISDRDKFTAMCKEDGIFIIVHKSQRYAITVAV